MGLEYVRKWSLRKRRKKKGKEKKNIQGKFRINLMSYSTKFNRLHNHTVPQFFYHKFFRPLDRGMHNQKEMDNY